MGNPLATTAHMVGVGPDVLPTHRRRRVAPREMRVKGNEQIILCNDTDDVIKIQFSCEELFGMERLDLDSGEKRVIFIPDVAARTECHYAIYCTDTADFAHGSSMPIIIVDPKD